MEVSLSAVPGHYHWRIQPAHGHQRGFQLSHTIFTAAGFSQLSSDSQGIALGVTNLLFTLVGMTLIDKFGRKSLLIVGAIGTAACLTGVAWIFNTHSHQSALLAMLVAFIAFFAISQGLVVFVYIGEVFPNAVRSKGQGVGNASFLR